jgi:hypothetical protein
MICNVLPAASLAPSIALPQIVRWHVQADRRREQQQGRRQQQRHGPESAERSASHTATTTANTVGATGSFASPEGQPVSGSTSAGAPTVQQHRRHRSQCVHEGGQPSAPWPVLMPWQHHLLPAGEAALASAIKNRRLCAQVTAQAWCELVKLPLVPHHVARGLYAGSNRWHATCRPRGSRPCRERFLPALTWPYCLCSPPAWPACLACLACPAYLPAWYLHCHVSHVRWWRAWNSWRDSWKS